jgi:subtilisin-like proprotein convertase family protein
MELWDSDDTSGEPTTPILGTACAVVGTTTGASWLDCKPAPGVVLPEDVWIVTVPEQDSGWIIANDEPTGSDFGAEVGYTGDYFAVMETPGTWSFYSFSSGRYAGLGANIWATGIPPGGACCWESGDPGTPNEIKTEILDLPVSNALDPTVSEIIIADPGIIGDLDVDLMLPHTYRSDLDIVLTHVQSGTSAVIASGIGGSGDNFGDMTLFPCTPDEECKFIFDDEGEPSTSLPENAVGHYMPSEPLSIFDGIDKAGTWTLTITDFYSGDDGTLVQWSLHFMKDPGGFGKSCDTLLEEECALLLNSRFNAHDNCENPDFVCDIGCGFDNGLPEGGALASQYCYDIPFVAAVADDFILNDQGANPCGIDSIVTWIWEWNTGDPLPTPDDWAGIWVTVYEDKGTEKAPMGFPYFEWTDPGYAGGIAWAGYPVYNEFFPVGSFAWVVDAVCPDVRDHYSGDGHVPREEHEVLAGDHAGSRLGSGWSDGRCSVDGAQGQLGDAGLRLLRYEVLDGHQ